MSKMKKFQRGLDKLAIRRKYFKSAADFLAVKETKEFAEALVSRIEALRDSHVATFDSCNPEDSLTIARCQEARKVCNDILRDFDPEICREEIKALDIEIKKIHNTMELEKEKELEIEGGFSSL